MSEECKELCYKILVLDANRKNIHYDRLEKMASNFFQEKFPKCKIEVKDKIIGVHLGNIFKIYP